jgi:hypothetical protein
MKKTLLILSIIFLLALIGFGLFYFFGNGKERVANFFSDNTFGSFFDVEPQSQNDFTNRPLDIPDDEELQDPANYVPPVLRQISFEPVSGYTFYATTSTTTEETIDPTTQAVTVRETTSTSTAIRFQERITGHIYDVFEFLPTPQKISNVTELKVYNTLFSNNKDQFVFQTPTFNNEQIRSAFAKLTFSTTTGTSITSNDISSSVSDFIFNPFSNKLVYSVKQNGVSEIFTANIDRTGEKSVTTLYFNEFLLDTINKDDVLLTTKASQTALGYSYILNTTTGNLTKILGNIPGLLVKVSPDKKYYLYSQSEQNRPSLRAYNATTREINIVTIDTLPSEKCVFSQKDSSQAYCFGSLIYKTGMYPDDWYKGKVLNYESLYKINLINNSVSVVYAFEADDLSFDALNIRLTDNDNFIIFQNKYDLTLWSIDLRRLSNELY